MEYQLVNFLGLLVRFQIPTVLDFKMQPAQPTLNYRLPILVCVNALLSLFRKYNYKIRREMDTEYSCKPLNRFRKRIADAYSQRIICLTLLFNDALSIGTTKRQ
jgi:hypothetical protein